MPTTRFEITRRQIRSSFSHFVHNEAIGGIILLCCAVIALVCANTSALTGFTRFWTDTNASIHLGTFSIDMSLEQWVNDGLMAVFFFVVGLEIKREMMVGELKSFKHSALPILAALGGMIFPALIYTIFNYGTPTSNGWGIPMATDIAFAIGILSLLGNRVPLGLKVFLTALAIVDDLGSIVVLAIFYPSHALHFDMLGYALLVVSVLLVFNKMKVNRILFYVIPGVALWYFVLQSGVHATIAGVLLALTIPSSTKINEVQFMVSIKHLLDKFKLNSQRGIDVLANPQQQEVIHNMSTEIRHVEPLMHTFEAALHPWVTFFIMPVFALVNSGVALNFSAADSIPPVAVGIFFGLFIGKPVGIFLFSLLSCLFKIAELPAGSNWKQLWAIGMIGGIGFTMSIFIDSLAFTDQSAIDMGKIAIIMTSVVVSVVGLIVVSLTCRKRISNKQ